jgi:3-hydroxyisobutyrate dehydrogenase
MLKTAFCGLGAIGAPMARHLAAGSFDLHVWNRTAATAASFATTNAVSHLPTPAEAARGRDIVVTCLPTSREVAALLDGPDGLLAGLAAGATLLDCTSGDPTTSRHIAARLAERGVHFVDAPVSGGVSGAEAGTLTVMCGGEDAAVARVRPVLEAFGSRIVHAGPVGAGHALKAVNNGLLAMNIWGAAEGLAALARAGVRPDLALTVINASSGRSNATENLFPERVLTGAYPRTFRAALLDKDVGIAADLARAERVPSPLLQLTAELWRMAHLELGEEADHVEAVRVIERLADIALRAGPLPTVSASATEASA